MPYRGKDDLVKVQSPTGKVHYAYLDFMDKEDVKIYDPLCNHRCWIGDYWGKKWALVDNSKEVTCKNCLSANGDLSHKVKVVRRIRAMDRNIIGKFRTKAEADAYIQGLEDAYGWPYIEINGKIPGQKEIK